MMYLNIFGDIWHAIKAIIQNQLNFIRGIFQFCVDSANFLKNFIEDTFNALKYILQAFRLAGDAINLLPSFIKVFAVITVGVLVAFQILGRSGGAK